jgi:hypothetical protein
MLPPIIRNGEYFRPPQTSNGQKEGPMTTKNKTMRERIAEREKNAYRNDTHDLVRAAREGLKAHGIERHDTYNLAKAAIALLLDSLNSGSKRDAVPGAVAGILTTHRFLQGQGIFTLLEALGELPKLENATDARNEHAYKACAELREALRERIFWQE